MVVLLQYTCQAHLVITLYMVNPCFRDSFHWPNSRDRCFGIGITLHFTPDLTTLPLIVCNTIAEDTCDSMKDSGKILKNSNIFDIWLTLETWYLVPQFQFQKLSYSNTVSWTRHISFDCTLSDIVFDKFGFSLVEFQETVREAVKKCFLGIFLKPVDPPNPHRHFWE